MAVRFVMVGGFHGAGKTTTIARLARLHIAQGRRVGIVTNDQAADLVDTLSLRAQGFEVGEVAGACFCCHFNELTDTVGRMAERERPDVVLAEPVGSCTDLAATVLQPLLGLYGGRFSVAPYAAICKPSHGLRILRGEGGFAPSAAYIFKKQLEEADLVLLNRADELSAADAAELADRVGALCPGTPLLRVSAKTGLGFEALFEFLEQDGDFGRKLLDIDYDLYAAGEAELGWLNLSARATAAAPFALDRLLLGVIEHLRASLDAVGAETAHLKAIGLHEGYYGVANLVSRGTPAELSLPSRQTMRQAEVVVNARVALAPEILDRLVRAALAAAAAECGAALEVAQAQSFRPGRPTPTHRYAVPA